MKKQTITIILALVACQFGGELAMGGYVDIHEDTIINNNIAVDSLVRIHNSAQITVLSTNYVSFALLNESTTTVHGGNASYRAQDSSTLILYGGDFTTRSPSVGYDGNLAKIYIYGENFIYQSSGGLLESGFLTGNWFDGTEFSIYFRALPQPFEQALGTNIFLIPEPLSFFLILSGFVGIRTFKI